MDWDCDTNRYKKALVYGHLILLSNAYPATFIEGKTRSQIISDQYQQFHVYQFPPSIGYLRCLLQDQRRLPSWPLSGLLRVCFSILVAQIQEFLAVLVSAFFAQILCHKYELIQTRYVAHIYQSGTIDLAVSQQQRGRQMIAPQHCVSPPSSCQTGPETAPPSISPPGFVALGTRAPT